MKVLFDGVICHPTGVATHHRNFVMALHKKGIPVQIFDTYRAAYGEELKELYKPIDAEGEDVLTISTYQPQFINKRSRKNAAFLVHEGSKIPDGWAEIINQAVETLLVPSKATKNLFFSNGVRIPIYVIPEGIDPEKFKPEGEKIKLELVTPDGNLEKFAGLSDSFMFLSVNSWLGDENDRKGTDLLIRAFAEEFKPEEKVILFLKVSAFFAPQFDVDSCIKRLGVNDIRIITDNGYVNEHSIPNLYRRANCFVSPTKGEAWGLTIGEAMACGVPVIVTKNRQAGYTDYVPENNLFVATEGMQQADRRFFCEGNMMPKVSISDLRQKMRYAFEHQEEMKAIGAKNAEHMKNFTWEKSAEKFIEVMGNGEKKDIMVN
jgi:glycosyltransferase involved in cell wall biosynthesis